MPNQRQRVGKEKSPPQPLSSSSAVQQFELELQWCIQQLEGALSTNKMAPKQAQDGARSLNILRSKNAPIIKKRQAMRSTFGDYRAKMAEEEKKLTKAQERITIAAPTPNKKSRFVKRSSVVCETSADDFTFDFETPPSDEGACTSQEVTSHNNFMYRNSNNGFRFDFETPPSDEGACTSQVVTSHNNFMYRSSDNSFRFNFVQSAS